VRFGIFHAKYAKDGKEGLRDEGVKGLRKRCGLCDRGVRFGIFHAKDAKGGKEILFFRKTFATFATVA